MGVSGAVSATVKVRRAADRIAVAWCTIRRQSGALVEWKSLPLTHGVGGEEVAAGEVF